MIGYFDLFILNINFEILKNFPNFTKTSLKFYKFIFTVNILNDSLYY